VHLSEQQVRRTAELGCWLVQNPRSNRGNRVGYAEALRASARVALGTDGYPSDLDAERSALLEESSHHGDDPAAAAQRPQAGHALLAERFGGQAPVAAAVQDIDLNTIRAQAAAEAPRLWSRMANL
jgi:cytosine/adenosine deaminase-related metal-dependent hydrolase